MNTAFPPIRTVIVDDEPPARRKLRQWLERDDSIHIIGEAGNGFDAVQKLTSQPPDERVELLFLDIQMPEINGLELLARLQEALPRLPLVVFVTAFDRYAVEAFKLHALDYLLKPYDEDRFGITLARAKSTLQGANGTTSASETMQIQIQALLSTLTPLRSYQRLFTVKSRRQVLLLKAEEVDFISTEGNYVALHRAAEEFLLREAMSRLEQRLDPAMFVRIHRSTLVNISAVHSFLPASHGDYVVVLKNGKRLDLSRNYREKLNAALGLDL